MPWNLAHAIIKDMEYKQVTICGQKQIWKCLYFFVTFECKHDFQLELLDIDECTKNGSPCDDNATCTDNNGSYECECNDGYTGDGYNCTGRLVISFDFLCVQFAHDSILKLSVLNLLRRTHWIRVSKSTDLMMSALAKALGFHCI